LKLNVDACPLGLAGLGAGGSVLLPATAKRAGPTVTAKIRARLTSSAPAPRIFAGIAVNSSLTSTIRTAMQHGISPPPLATASNQPLWQQPASSVTVWRHDRVEPAQQQTQGAALPSTTSRLGSNHALKNQHICNKRRE
jgi:hypothetical protein